ncbi:MULTISPECIES: DICT sensory domain-containing protein [unclassified Nocardioides]|uniref:DICT sensory domain-containing protein n=1 Tax=unclassified Nocardioides TaxID=2615069 RepID=UPI0030147585
MSSDPDLLSIGDLAQATGVNATTLRAWETRFGFPVAMRLPSGHRRYRREDVAAVRSVAQRRDSGLRLDVAIAEILDSARPSTGSVFTTLRREHPHLRAERLHKSTLTALSWAIEDEFCAQADRARIFGAFQTGRLYRPSRARWTELARLAASATVFADFTGTGDLPDDAPVTRIHLDPVSPMRREWVVVCDSADLPVALTAWELPGQETVADSRRVFEAIWTVEPAAVRDAARACARVAHEYDPEVGAPLLFALADAPTPVAPGLSALNSMFTRMLTYVDRHQAREHERR